MTDARGVTTTRVYDALNRVTTATSTLFPKSEVVSWSYDDPTAGRFAIGRLAAMTDPSGSTAYHYERRGLLSDETRKLTGAQYTYTTGFQHDADGNRARVHRIGVPSRIRRNTAAGTEYARLICLSPRSGSVFGSSQTRPTRTTRRNAWPPSRRALVGTRWRRHQHEPRCGTALRYADEPLADYAKRLAAALDITESKEDQQ
jgi:YD repeat-containing protein